jgi:hypothetical protein
MLKVCLKTSNRLNVACQAWLSCCFWLLVLFLVWAGCSRLKINLDKLHEKASESVEITIDERLLKLPPSSSLHQHPTKPGSKSSSPA